MRRSIQVWSLRLDLAIANVLLWASRVRDLAELRPDVHAYLFDRYWRLALRHDRARNTQRADQLRQRAELHRRLSGGDWPPAALALAMPVPRPPLWTFAVGGHHTDEPDDAA